MSRRQLKYLLLTGQEGGSYSELLRGKHIERAGLYNWMRIFDGDVDAWPLYKERKKNIREYDIIHVNLCGKDIGLASEVRPYLKEPNKLVVNLDYAVEHFQFPFDKNQKTLGMFLADLKAADMVFGVEPFQVELVNYLLRIQGLDKTAALIPHPIDVDNTFKFFVPLDKRNEELAFMWHIYDSHWEIPKALMLGLDTTKVMYGYVKKGFASEPPDMVHRYGDWKKYIKRFAQAQIGFEYRTHHAASRFILEGAVLGVPIVSTKFSYLGTVLFPELCHDPWQFAELHNSLYKLLNDEEYRFQIVNEARKKVEIFGFNQSRTRFLAELRRRTLVTNNE